MELSPRTNRSPGLSPSSIGQISASANLARIAERFQVLESLYNQARQICTGLEDRIEGYGIKRRWAPDPQFRDRLEEIYRIYGNIGIPTVPVEEPNTFREIMHEIGIFLKYLSGLQLTEEEMLLLESSQGLYDLQLALVPSSGPTLDNAIEPVINWLTNTVEQCRNLQGYSTTSRFTQELYPAAANLLRIVNRIRLLESFYEQAREMCSGLEDKLKGYGTRWQYPTPLPLEGLPGVGGPPTKVPMTFREIMNEIGIYLRFLSGQQLAQEEYQGPLDSLRYALGTNITTGRLNFDESLEPILLWLYNSLNRCRQVQSGISTAQQLQLERLYSPTGQLAEQAAQRYYGTAAQQQRY